MRRGVRQLLELDPGLKWSPKRATARARSIWRIDWYRRDLAGSQYERYEWPGYPHALRRDGVTAQIIILTVSDASAMSLR